MKNVTFLMLVWAWWALSESLEGLSVPICIHRTVQLYTFCHYTTLLLEHVNQLLI